MSKRRQELKRKGWATFGTFAFCVPGEPGRISQEATESDQPRKVPAAELAARYDVLQSRVKPLRLVDRLEPSHALVNLAAQMIEDQRVKYIEWSRCTSRAQEINSVKEDHSLKMLQGGRQGSVRLVEPAARITAETRSDLQLMQALRHRGVAYELAALMTFEKHEELIDKLFLEYQREPLAGFHAVSVDQLQAADREVHVRMAELTRSGLVPGADGALPLDGPVTSVLASSQIQWMLMPRPKGSGSGHGGTGAEGNPEKPGKPPKKPPPKKTDPTKASDKDQQADPPGHPH
ncbi:unnamed protein product, partial [Symbiodinium necroappetens]